MEVTNRHGMLVRCDQYVMDWTSAFASQTAELPDTTTLDGVAVTNDSPIDCRGAKAITITIDGSDAAHVSSNSSIRVISSNKVDVVPESADFDNHYALFTVTDGSVITYSVAVGINWLRVRGIESAAANAKPKVTINVSF